MIASEAAQERVPLTAERLSKERIARLERLSGRPRPPPNELKAPS